ncbi:MAG: hypothetical protein K0R73_1207 [Candidatus Midichloriaceae bacterium]|jgi:hypothetical protein|nr:hypothetical protein [Candidatus Midichloriaceae bacterium]
MPNKPLISFDYAIKYLLKDKGDYEIIEGFISALPKSQGETKKDVKIIALLDTESNREEDIKTGMVVDATNIFLVSKDIDIGTVSKLTSLPMEEIKNFNAG